MKKLFLTFIVASLLLTTTGCNEGVIDPPLKRGKVVAVYAAADFELRLTEFDNYRTIDLANPIPIEINGVPIEAENVIAEGFFEKHPAEGTICTFRDLRDQIGCASLSNSGIFDPNGVFGAGFRMWKLQPLD